MNSSSSCFFETGVGQSVIRSEPFCVFGNAITSRSELGAGHQHREAIEAERDAAVRRRPVLERVEQEAELRARSSSEIRSALNARAWSSLRWIRIEPPPTSTPLSTRSYARASTFSGAVSSSASSSVARRRERVVRRRDLWSLVDLEQRRIGEPHELPLAFADQAELVADVVEPDRAERRVRDLGLVGDEDQRVARDRLRAGDPVDLVARGVAEALRERRLPHAALADLRAHATFAPNDFAKSVRLSSTERDSFSRAPARAGT